MQPISRLKNTLEALAGAEHYLFKTSDFYILFSDTLQPNQVKNRDLWDIVWLYRRNIVPDKKLLEQKSSDRKIDIADFRRIYSRRITEIRDKQQHFLSEMRRFLSPAVLTKDLADPVWWDCLRGILEDFSV